LGGDTPQWWGRVESLIGGGAAGSGMASGGEAPLSGGHSLGASGYSSTPYGGPK